MKEKDKKAANERATTANPGFHSGVKLRQPEKAVVKIVHDHKTQKRALSFTERSQANKADKQGGGIKK